MGERDAFMERFSGVFFWLEEFGTLCATFLVLGEEEEVNTCVKH